MFSTVTPKYLIELVLEMGCESTRIGANGMGERDRLKIHSYDLEGLSKRPACEENWWTKSRLLEKESNSP